MIKNKIEEAAFRRLKKLSKKEFNLLIKKVENLSFKKGFLYRRSKKEKPFPHPIALIPFVVPEAALKQFQDLARAVYKFQLKLPPLYKKNFKNSRCLFPLHPNLEAWLKFYRWMNHPKNLLIRLDTTFGVDKKTNRIYPILFETNSTALAGLYNHAFGAEVLNSSVLPKIFRKTELNKLSPGPNLLDFIYQWSGGDKYLNIAFIENIPIEKNYGEIPRIADYFKLRGKRVIHSSPDNLKRSVDLIYRDLPFKNINFKLKFFKQAAKADRIMPGVAADFSYKGILECFTAKEYQKFFTKEERRIFKKSVPWTRVFFDRKTEDSNGKRIDLIFYVKKNQKQLVLKPNLDAGGDGVVFGKDATRPAWNGLIARALKEKGHWVVQKAVAAPTKKMAYLKNGEIYFADCYFTFGIFYYPDQIGLHCRISPFKVANVGRGGALACVFVEKN